MPRIKHVHVHANEAPYRAKHGERAHVFTNARSECQECTPPTSNAPNLIPGHAYCDMEDCWNIVPDTGMSQLCGDCEEMMESE